jgi:hypothetical protein
LGSVQHRDEWQPWRKAGALQAYGKINFANNVIKRFWCLGVNVALAMLRLVGSCCAPLEKLVTKVGLRRIWEQTFHGEWAEVFDWKIE